MYFMQLRLWKNTNVIIHTGAVLDMAFLMNDIAIDLLVSYKPLMSKTFFVSAQVKLYPDPFLPFSVQDGF